MTDKERLRTIKIRLTFGSMNLCNAPRLNNFESPFEIVQKEDLTWLIQQVERVQELESDNARLRKRNKELREFKNLVLEVQ